MGFSMVTHGQTCGKNYGGSKDQAPTGLQPEDRSTWKPKYIVYTVFKSRDDGCFRDFDKYDRHAAAWRCDRMALGIFGRGLAVVDNRTP